MPTLLNVPGGSRFTVIWSVAVFWAVSRAVTVMTLAPALSAMPSIDQFVVPVAVPFAPVAAFAQRTVETVDPPVSLAVPPRSSVPR